VGLWWGGPGVGPTGARRMAWTASDAGAGLWRRLPVGMGWPGTAAPITAVRCVWGIELSRPAIARDRGLELPYKAQWLHGCWPPLLCTVLGRGAGGHQSAPWCSCCYGQRYLATSLG
jgi:hypothetical protein